MPEVKPIVKTAVSYSRTLEVALEELTKLMAEREALDEKREVLHQRIMKLRGAVRGLASLCDVEGIDDAHPHLFPNEWGDGDVGLTDAIRQVLSSHEDAYLSPVFIRDRLADVGFDIKTHKNILASIHTVLKRLQRQGEAAPATREGRTAYRWIAKKTEKPDDAEATWEDGDIPF
jgi:hypothetical protein